MLRDISKLVAYQSSVMLCNYYVAAKKYSYIKYVLIRSSLSQPQFISFVTYLRKDAFLEKNKKKFVCDEIFSKKLVIRK